MSKPKQGQAVGDNNLGPKAVGQLAQDLKKFDEVLRTIELRRMGFGTTRSDGSPAVGMASDEDVLKYFASVDAVYGEFDADPEASQPMLDDAHAKPLPGTRPRKVAKESSEKTI